MCFQISSDLKLGRHIPNSNLSKVEYAIKMINNAKDLIPPPSENEIVSKLSRHFQDDIRTAIIIRNIKTYENFIELLDDFDQAGPSNSNSDDNGIYGHSSYKNERFRHNAYGEFFHSNGSNFRGRNFVLNIYQNNFGVRPTHAQHNFRRENINAPNTGATEPTRSRGGETGVQRGNPENAQDGIRKVRTVANASRTMQGRSNENLNTLSNGDIGIENIINDADVLNN